MVTKPVVSDPISTDLKRVMRQLKLGRMLDTLPDRLTLARQQHLSHAAFLELVLADEATRRDTSSAARRARDAGLDAAMRLDTWDESAAVRYDRTLWTDLTSLRFLDAAHVKDLVALLRLDTEGGDRPGFETANADRLVGLLAIAVGTVVNPVERRIDLRDQLAFAGAGAQLDRAFSFQRCAVGQIRLQQALLLQVLRCVGRFGQQSSPP